MNALSITMITLYSGGLIFSLLLIYTSVKNGATKEDSKAMVALIFFLLWAVSPVLMAASLAWVVRGFLRRD